MEHAKVVLMVTSAVACGGCVTSTAPGAAPGPTTTPAPMPAPMPASVPVTAASPAPVAGPAAQPEVWRSLFDGRTLDGWKATDFGGQGDVRIDDGTILMMRGENLTGITWTGGDLPRTSYEISLEAMKVNGGDFFCGLTFPVAESPCSLIVGGWGGSVVGLSSLDGFDASENQTTSHRSFARGRWYRIRLRVTPSKIQAWIDDEPVVDVVTSGKQIDIRPEVWP